MLVRMGNEIRIAGDKTERISGPDSKYLHILAEHEHGAVDTAPMVAGP